MPLDQKNVIESEQRAALIHFNTDQVCFLGHAETCFYMYMHIQAHIMEEGLRTGLTMLPHYCKQ